MWDWQVKTRKEELSLRDMLFSLINWQATATRLSKSHSIWWKIHRDDSNALTQILLNLVPWVTSMAILLKAQRTCASGKLSLVTFTIQHSLSSINFWCVLKQSGCVKQDLYFYSTMASMVQVQNTRLVTWRDSSRILIHRHMTQLTADSTTWQANQLTFRLLSAPHLRTISTFWEDRCYVTSESPW